MRDFRNILYAMDLDVEHFSSMVRALEFARLFGSRIHSMSTTRRPATVIRQIMKMPLL